MLSFPVISLELCLTRQGFFFGSILMKFNRESAASRGYDRQWRKARAEWLAIHPLCSYCQSNGRSVAAEVVDHIKPHRGDAVLFWDRRNWQSLCKSCHDSRKSRQERGGVEGIGKDGLPIGKHWWRGGVKIATPAQT